MDKRAMYIAAFAMAIVVLFIIEPFAIGIIQSAGISGGNGGANGNETSGTVLGNANANVTIVRYEPYLIVSGNSSAIEAVKDRLVGEGRATYAVWSGDSLVVSMKSSKDVPSAASEFELVNASSLATAYISTAQTVKVVSNDGREVEAGGMSLNMQVVPLYEEGSTHEASFAARAEGGELTGIGSISILPLAVKGVPVEAALSSQPQETCSVMVAWKDRQAAKPLALARGAAYKERSFIYVANATKEQLDAAVAGLAYVTGTQPGIISVQNDYTDSESVGLALFQNGLTAVFPQSVATFANASGNGSAVALIGELEALNASAELAVDWTAKIRLPSVLESNGRRYFGPEEGIELLIEGTGEPRENVTAMNVSVDFEAAGSQIARVTAVNPQ
jgi:hypothetical protein